MHCYIHVTIFAFGQWDEWVHRKLEALLMHCIVIQSRSKIRHRRGLSSLKGTQTCSSNNGNPTPQIPKRLRWIWTCNSGFHLGWLESCVNSIACDEQDAAAGNLSLHGQMDLLTDTVSQDVLIGDGV